MVLGMENFDKKSLTQHFKKRNNSAQYNQYIFKLLRSMNPVLFKNFCYINICTENETMLYILFRNLEVCLTRLILWDHEYGFWSKN